MRRIALLVVAGAAALTALPAAPASAYCSPVMFYVTGFCNPCYAMGVPWGVADRATGGALGPLYCLD